MDAILRQGAAQFNLKLTDAQLAAFDTYARQLIDWNRRVNLTRIVNPAEIAVKHFLDSLSVVAVLPNLPPGAALIDVGSGAGLPGLPLKIALPHLRLTLLESTGKKCRFLEHIAGVLALPDVAVLNARAEDAGQNPDHRGRYDAAVARAVAALPVLAEYMLPLVKVGGRAVAQKGQNPAAESKSAANALGVLGGKIVETRPVNISGLDGERHLIVLQKTKTTPAPYPRRPGLPAKKPI